MEAAARQTNAVIEREFATASPATTARGAATAAAFDPQSIGLAPDFVLTNFSALKGCGCKLPQVKLLSYLDNVMPTDVKPNETPGMDSSVVKIAHGSDLYLVSTTDFFFPSVEDPYVQGQIACANVLSDVYAMGVTEVDTMLMILGVCRDMSEKQRDVVTTEMIRGFNDLARKAQTNVTGGQTVMNPWPIVGGVAMSVRSEAQIIRPENAVVGDVIVLTKPLGTQVAVNVFQWKKKPEQWQRVAQVVTSDDADVAFEMASESMSRLNLNAAKMMHKHGAHSATDVTGFGLLAHARNQAKSQLADVSFELHTLPIIKNMVEVNKRRTQKRCIQELRELDDKPAWIVGCVVAGSKDAYIVPSPTIIEVSPED
ncbi:unnamed protein product [Hyaloperonospora brassicae]|uniref:Selenide, water dikinase n=1 Tax=Hyaloperonospora brassicae TaxID=162125 RepID=A0AAV0TPI4_HYABA|nr:unnamed protein product [Hyaloperonospora brassicae]